MKSYKFIGFYNGKKLLCKIGIEGYFFGEIKETRSLLAYENNLNLEDIEVKFLR